MMLSTMYVPIGQGGMKKTVSVQMKYMRLAKPPGVTDRGNLSEDALDLELYGRGEADCWTEGEAVGFSSESHGLFSIHLWSPPEGQTGSCW